jgi:hypothetical protein
MIAAQSGFCSGYRKRADSFAAELLVEVALLETLTTFANSLSVGSLSSR